MSPLGQTRSFGDVRSIAGQPESRRRSALSRCRTSANYGLMHRTKIASLDDFVGTQHKDVRYYALERRPASKDCGRCDLGGGLRWAFGGKMHWTPRHVPGSKHMEADMRKPVHGMIAGASVATALALTVAVAAAQTPAPQFDLTKVTDQVYSFRSGITSAMIVATSDGVIVTDPINSKAAKNMMDEIRKVTDKPVKFVIYSHNHWDHIAGARIFKDQGAKIIQHAL